MTFNLSSHKSGRTSLRGSLSPDVCIACVIEQINIKLIYHACESAGSSVVERQFEM